jgi:hypothetical protein
MAPEVILTNNYYQKCDIFSFAIMMFQLLTKKIDNIYDKVDTQTKEKKNENDKIIELKEVNNYSNNSNNIANIELRVANDPNFRPSIPI